MQARRKIAVAGATGRLGRHLVDVLTEQGHDVVAMARSKGVDVITGDGLAEALTGVEMIIDAAASPSGEQEAAATFFTTAAGNLHRAGQRAGVRRLVAVSIIGIDRGFTSGYLPAQLAHEKATLAGPIPAQIVRAAQFNEFVEVLMQWGRQGDVVYLPKMRTQLVACRAAAEVLAGLAIGDPLPAGAPIPEIAGPRAEDLTAVAALVAARRHEPLKIEEVSPSGDPDDELNASGGLLPSPHATLVGPTFADWLDAS